MYCKSVRVGPDGLEYFGTTLPGVITNFLAKYNVGIRTQSQRHLHNQGPKTRLRDVHISSLANLLR